MPAVTPDSEVPLDNMGPEVLPARRRRPRPGGRHRGAESFALPPDSPPLILAVPGALDASVPPVPPGRPGAPEPSGRPVVAGVAGALALLTEHAHTGRPVVLGHLAGSAASLGAALAAAAAAGRAPDMPPAVVVPLLAGPDPVIDRALRETVVASGVPAVIAEPLGPHPLIAQALHERLAEAGLARADRIRMMTTVTVAGGVVIAVPGGPAAVRDAEVSAVLLASRLAVPATAASLEDGPDAISPAEAAARLRAAGATHVAFAPYVIGPEVAPARLAMLSKLAADTGAGLAAPLGDHPVLAHLIALRYVEALEKALREGQLH
ncbi:Sirohydrochlorin ferrochelatase [Thermomonospora echinospora]|uniref:Sirohydrochlorin ferrochelatase n=1 Tax=Thermomonospora echinospora TaxID=1992 RepID=A0A1H5V4Y1_9ACTN|nr:Sirohydrochlorin ferrochelatase [Thermomonospora echinospora]